MSRSISKCRTTGTTKMGKVAHAYSRVMRLLFPNRVLQFPRTVSAPGLTYTSHAVSCIVDGMTDS